MRAWFLIGLVWVSPIPDMVLSVHADETTTVARVAPDGNAIELEYRLADGKTLTETIPIHEAGPIRYFSTGIGKEERQAVYPPFPLKVMFVLGERAYVTRVGVTLKEESGNVIAEIPPEHMAGPWLFIDLPPGSYQVVGHREQQLDVSIPVKVEKGRQTVGLIRWKEKPVSRDSHRSGAAS